jgi:hypothetical protein
MIYKNTHDDRGEVCMVDRRDYESIQKRILSLLREDDSSIEPPELLAQLNKEGIPQGLASTIMWEMIRAGYIRLEEGWRLSRGRKLEQRAEVLA